MVTSYEPLPSASKTALEAFIFANCPSDNGMIKRFQSGFDAAGVELSIIVEPTSYRGFHLSIYLFEILLAVKLPTSSSVMDVIL